MAKPQRRLPTDGQGEAVQLTPDVPALARTLDTSISSSTEVTLNAGTTFLRLYATEEDVYFKWGTSDVTSANFDEILPAGQIVDLVVPEGQTAFNVLERASGAAIIAIEK